VEPSIGVFFCGHCPLASPAGVAADSKFSVDRDDAAPAAIHALGDFLDRKFRGVEELNDSLDLLLRKDAAFSCHHDLLLPEQMTVSPVSKVRADSAWGLRCRLSLLPDELQSIEEGSLRIGGNLLLELFNLNNQRFLIRFGIHPVLLVS
jgi:hypothetical protein